MGQTNWGRQGEGFGKRGDTHFTSKWPPTKKYVHMCVGLPRPIQPSFEQKTDFLMQKSTPSTAALMLHAFNYKSWTNQAPHCIYFLFKNRESSLGVFIYPPFSALPYSCVTLLAIRLPHSYVKLDPERENVSRNAQQNPVKQLVFKSKLSFSLLLSPKRAICKNKCSDSQPMYIKFSSFRQTFRKM